MKALLDALAVQACLEQHGISTVLCGGAVRDIHLGRTPKDFDLVLLSRVCEDDPPIEDAIDALDMLQVSLVPFGEGASMEANSSPNLNWVIKVAFHGTDVDVIQLACSPKTPEEVVENFDCTLNMAWVDYYTNVLTLHPRFPAPGAVVEMLPKCDFPVDRSCYLSQKFPEYQWPLAALPF